MSSRTRMRLPPEETSMPQDNCSIISNSFNTIENEDKQSTQREDKGDVFEPSYLHSIAPYTAMIKSKPSDGQSPTFMRVIGNYETSVPDDGYKEGYHPSIIQQAWNETFRKVINVGVDQIYIISTSLDLLYLGLAYHDPTLMPNHYIIYDCSGYMLLSAIKQLGQNRCKIVSVAFVKCSFGGSDDTLACLGRLFDFADLKALSFSNCTLREDFGDTFFQELVLTSSIPRITRFEVKSTCRNVAFTRLIPIFEHTVVSLSQQHKCTCPEGLDQTHVYLSHVTKIIKLRTSAITELEFEMDFIPQYELVSVFKTIAWTGILETLSLNCSIYNEEMVAIYTDFFKSAKGLTSIEIKNANYFPAPSKDYKVQDIPNIFQLMSPIYNQIHHISIKDVTPNQYARKHPELTNTPVEVFLNGSLEQFKYLKSLQICNCEFADMNESLVASSSYFPKKFQQIIHPTHLTHLVLRDLHVIDWLFIGQIADSLPTLVKLDISAINTKWIPRGARDTNNLLRDGICLEQNRVLMHPVQLLFCKLNRLQELAMDDLDIGDETMFGGLDVETATYWMVDRKEETAIPTVADLKALRKLSMKNTKISNITIRCVGRYMPNVTFINVSYTHVNDIGICEARCSNPSLCVIAKGCRLRREQQSECLNPHWGEYISSALPSDGSPEETHSGEENQKPKSMGIRNVSEPNRVRMTGWLEPGVNVNGDGYYSVRNENISPSSTTSESVIRRKRKI